MLAYVCLSVCVSVTLIFQLCLDHLGSLRYHWNWLGKGMLYSEFYTISNISSGIFLIFHAISPNFADFSHFLGQF